MKYFQKVREILSNRNYYIDDISMEISLEIFDSKEFLVAIENFSSNLVEFNIKITQSEKDTIEEFCMIIGVNIDFFDRIETVPK